MKSKKTLFLLLIGAAAILTVIWSTRNTSKPVLLTTTTNSLVIPHVQDRFLESSSNKNPPVQEQCPIIPNVKADIDTSDVYPTLNFNVS